MRSCLACDRDYTDESLSYCLMCGSRLVEGENQPTMAIRGGEPTAVLTAAATPRMTGTERPKRTYPWIILFTVAGIIIFLFSFFWVQRIMQIGGKVKANQNAARNTNR